MIRNNAKFTNRTLCWMCHIFGLTTAALAMSLMMGAALGDEPDAPKDDPAKTESPKSDSPSPESPKQEAPKSDISDPDVKKATAESPEQKSGTEPKAEPAHDPHHDGQLPGITPHHSSIIPVEEFNKPASWTIPSVIETRTAMQKFLNELKKSEAAKLMPEVEEKITALWPVSEESLDATAQLDRVAASLALIDPRYEALVAQCKTHRNQAAAPQFTWLTEESTPEFVRNNLRLYFGRWLSQERYFEESKVTLDKLEPTAVIDPVSLLFFQSVNHHVLLNKTEGMKSLAKMFERPDDLPQRYQLLGRMMEIDLRALKEDSLDHISRRMNIVKDWMEFGRSGKKTQGEEVKVIAALDKLIEEMEKEKEGKSGSGQGGGGGGQGQSGDPQGIKSTDHAKESKVAKGKGDGNVDRKKIGSQSGWGDLPPKEREEALQQIGKDFPSHYRDIVEEYFRRRAESE